MNGHGGGLVYLLCVCVRGDMMDVCSNCDSGCCLDGKGIIECEGFFSRWVLYHPRIRTLIYQNCNPERQHQVVKQWIWLSFCSLCLINEGTTSSLLSCYWISMQVPGIDSCQKAQVKANINHTDILSTKQWQKYYYYGWNYDVLSQSPETFSLTYTYFSSIKKTCCAYFMSPKCEDLLLLSVFYHCEIWLQSFQISLTNSLSITNLV